MIKAFSGDSPSLTITAVAERTGLTRAVARRYLFTLRELGCVAEHERRFSLTPKILDLGFTYLSTMSVADLAQPVMESVVAELHESCSLSVLDGRDVVYVGRVPTKRIMSVNLVVGSRLPAHATSMGKVMLAYADDATLAAFFSGPPLRAVDATNHLRRGRVASGPRRSPNAGVGDGRSGIGGRHSIGGRTGWDRRQRVAAAINVSAHATRVSQEELCQKYLPVPPECRSDDHRIAGRAGPPGRRAACGERWRPSRLLAATHVAQPVILLGTRGEARRRDQRGTRAANAPL